MPQSSTRLRDLPHYRISADELAKWLHEQNAESWWSLDGDRILSELLDFPGPADEVACALRPLGKHLLVLEVRKEATAQGQTISANQLDAVAFMDEAGDRVSQLSWEEGPDLDWLLVEDIESSESYSDLDTTE